MGFLSAIGSIAGGLLGGPAGAAVGGALGGAVDSKSAKGGTTSQTAVSEPWAAAQPWLRDNIQIGQDLQKTYQQTPFNTQQIQSYNNLFGDLDQFRNQMAPGLLDFSNQMMNGQYQRPVYSQPGMVGYSAQRSQFSPINPAFSMPQSTGNYGLLDTKQTTPQILPSTMIPGQTQDKVWEAILQQQWDDHLAKFGIDWNTARTTDLERENQLKWMQNQYKSQMGW